MTNGFDLAAITKSTLSSHNFEITARLKNSLSKYAVPVFTPIILSLSNKDLMKRE